MMNSYKIYQNKAFNANASEAMRKGNRPESIRKVPTYCFRVNIRSSPVPCADYYANNYMVCAWDQHTTTLI
jgi:hypothetical protein